jgi:citrate lyase beta subunit
MASVTGRNVARKLVRSVIFTPADRPSAMMKAVNSLDADVVVLDLEDAVSPDLKLTARSNVVNFLKSGPFNRCSVVVRVNCPKTTPWGIDDINALYNLGFDAIILPKVEEESMIDLTTSITKERSHTGISLISFLAEDSCQCANDRKLFRQEYVQPLLSFTKSQEYLNYGA